MCADTSGNALLEAQLLRFAADAAGIALWTWNVDTDEFTMDARAHTLWGVPNDGSVTFADLSAHIYPEDRDKVRDSFHATRSVYGPFEIDFRILKNVAVRWISARGQGGDPGLEGRITYGIFLDVTENRQAEELRELLTAEMDHRIKNLFSIASALTTIAARSAATTTEMARDLTHRLQALGRAQDLVRPVPGKKMEKVLVSDLFAILLGPYDENGVGAGRVHVSVLEDVSVGNSASTTLALIVHELATNSIKYGALSTPNGRLDVSFFIDGDVVSIVWSESGGPPVSTPTGPSGFGSRLVARSISGQLNGSISFAWPTEGVVITLTMSRSRLST
ncbi:MAG: HWE histidine kinase domain-containing protein [Hyphomicrobium sp.]